MQKNIFGKKGEIIAKNFLKKKKFKILEANYKNKIGEIDIIAKHKDYLVFVEVKTRTSIAFGDPAEAVDENKQFKIRQVAELYLIEHKLTEKPCRFDVVAILDNETDIEVRHIEDAF